jgi:threonine/homoserine/homoserine lactone efflux protein
VLNPEAAVFFVTFLPHLLLAFGARLALARH